MQFLQITWDYHPHAPHIFHAHLCNDHHIVSPHPFKTALHIPPCGTCAKLLSNHMFFHLISKPSCPAIQKPTMHGHPKLFQHCHFALIFGHCIYHGKCVAPLQHQFHFFHIPFLAILWISDRHASPLHHSSLTFLVYCCHLCLWSSLSGQVFSLIPPAPTKFHHHLSACIHSTPVTPGSRPLSTHFGGATYCGFH